MLTAVADPFALPAFILSIVSLVVATIGALTGVVALVWQIVTRTRGAHRVVVEVSNAVVVGDAVALNPGGDAGVLICVEAMNRGASAISLTSWGFERVDKQGGFAIPNVEYPSTSLPHMLLPGTSAKFFVAAQHLGDTLRLNPGLTPSDLRGFVQLATGRKAFARRSGIPLADEFWRD